MEGRGRAEDDDMVVVAFLMVFVVVCCDGRDLGVRARKWEVLNDRSKNK